MDKFFKKNKFQILRFLIAGIVASSINFFVFSLFYFFLKNILLASFCGYFSGLLVSFIFAKIWVFQKNSKQKIFKSFFVFCLIYFLGGLEMSFVIFSLDKLINNHQIAWLFGALIGSINNYMGSKYFLFRN